MKQRKNQTPSNHAAAESSRAAKSRRAATSGTMTTPRELHRQDICGIPVSLCIEFDCSTMNYPALCQQYVQHHAATAARCMSTLVPRDAEVVTLVTTETETFVLFPDAEGSNLFMARPSFSARHILGQNAIVHGWLYRDTRKRTHVAVFDASKLENVNIRGHSALERHVAVHHLLHPIAADAAIHYHWCGFEAQCMRPYHTFKLNFDVSGIARLSENLAEQMLDPATKMVRILPCLLVGEGDLRPTIFVPPRRQASH